MINTILQYVGGFFFTLAYGLSLCYAISVLGKRLSYDHKCVAGIIVTAVIYFSVRLGFNI